MPTTWRQRRTGTGAQVAIGEHIKDVQIFMPDYGTARADFPGGDAHSLFRLIRRLLALSR